MKIRPKNIEIIKALTGVKFTSANANGANWRQLVFNNYRLHLLDLLLKYGNTDDYGLWLNDMLSRHARLYKAANESGDWLAKAYSSEDVGKYLHDYKGDLRFGTYSPKDDYKTDFNWLGIEKALEQNRYDTSGPRRTSGDYGNHDFKVDNLYSAITDDRRLLGRKGDWDPNSEEFKLWQKELNDRGWETYLDTSDDYYKLRRLQSLNTSSTIKLQYTKDLLEGRSPVETRDGVDYYLNGDGLLVPAEGAKVPTGHKETYRFDWNKLKEAATGIFNNPNLYATGRLIGQLINNDRIYDAALKGIRPDLKLTYYTHRQVVGDEATKQAYYRRAAQGQTLAALPFTSDADKQMAYLYEAKRIGDELRALGDLADNQEIRRTSDESNQHQWANTQRATEVANANIAAINLANSLKQNLLALKYASNWASIDNYLQGIEYRKRQQLAEQEAIKDEMFTLDHTGYLYTPEYLKAYKKLDDVLEKHKKADGSYDKTHPEVVKARAEFDNYLKEVKRKQLLDLLDYKSGKIGISWGKSGVKITRKKKDDLLYKSTKDTVDHFRKMSKISSDAQNRKKPKIEKLTSHPKGNTRKYLLGGVAPFGVYKPVALGGETTTSSQASTSSTSKASKDSGKDTLDLIKTLFSKVTDKALPIDANLIYSSMSNLFSKYEMFGLELSTSDIASMYLSSMQQIVGLLHSKEVHEKAKTLATLNDALNEFAVTATGNYILLNEESGKLIESKSLEKEGYTPITNQHLLYLREYDPDLALKKGDYWIENVINNGMGVNKIGALIKALAGNIGSSESKIENVTKVESDKIKAGLRELSEAPDGYYKISLQSKNSNSQIEAALNYITNMLSPSLTAILNAHGGAKALVYSFLTSQTSSSASMEIDPLTGKAAKDANGNSKSGSGSSDNSAGTSFVLGLGPHIKGELNPGTAYAVRVLGIKGTFQTHSGENLGAGDTLYDATKSQQGGYMHWLEATFGGSRLNLNAAKHIILNDSSILGLDLPYRVDRNGNSVPDFLMLKLMEEADEIIATKGISKDDYNAINQIYKSKGLPDKYNANGDLNAHKYKRFAAFSVTLDEESLKNKEAILSEEVALANDVERDLYVEIMKSKEESKKYDLDSGMWLTGWGKDNLYKGTIFVPYDEDIAFSAVSSGKPFDLGLPNNSSTVEIMQHAPAVLKYLKALTTEQMKLYGKTE